MAETILIPVAKQIVEKLGSFALDQIALVWSLRNELEKLKGTVSTIEAVLLDAEKKQGRNRQVKDWLEKLSDVMYDADDLLDDFSTETRRQRAGTTTTTTTTSCWSVVCFVFSLTKRFSYEHGMARAIRAIREKLEDIKNDREFHLEELGEEQALPVETDPCPPMIVVGRDADKAEIVRLLLHCDCEEANVSVVPIVGMGGLGKTTLAQLVFDDKAVASHFELRAWVHVSQSFDVKGILEKMLQSMTRGSRAGLQLAVLQDELRDLIRGKRFLVVLDDVWEENANSWEDLAKYLMVGAVGSKVLVTTRSSKVAEIGSEILKLGTGRKVLHMPYCLGGFSLDESWSLLVSKALHGEVQQSLDVERTGREILKRCCGVPLAVSTIAGLLRSRDPESEWPLFLHGDLSNILQEENHIMATLRLSFDHLPSKLKHCFSYCKLFLKGDDLDVRRLVQLWMAQGYVVSEDEGLDCFKTLCWRSFFQELEVDESGNPWRCRMHDLMHDLAGSIVGERIIQGFSFSLLERVPSKTRHVSVVGFLDDYDAGNCYRDSELMGDVSKVRTLIISDGFDGEDCRRTLHNFKRLRALQMHVDELDPDPCEEKLLALGELKHLRFLGLESILMERPPNSITKLLNLQVLDLSSCYYITELPRDVRKLVDLKHIYLHQDVKLKLIPKGIGDLAFLQTLPVFAVGHRGDERTAKGAAGLDELSGLSLRGELKITNLAHSQPASGYVLKNKLLLQSLVLDWKYYYRYDEVVDDNDEDAATRSANDEQVLEMLCPHPNLKKLKTLNYKGANLPNWLSTITNLMELSLEDCNECEYLPPLHQLPSLKKLCIRMCDKLNGITDNDHEHGSSGWPQFPCLVSLSIYYCPNLTRMPTFPTLEDELVVGYVNMQPLIRTMKMNEGSFPRPLSKLKKLKFAGIEDLHESLPEYDFSSSSSLVSLQQLTLASCSELPNWLGSLASLTEISIEGCFTATYNLPLHQRSHLKKLAISYSASLYELKWNQQGTNISGADDDDNDDECPYFAALSSLEISSCPRLSRMPLFPTVDAELKLYECSARLLLRTMTMKSARLTHPPLSRLLFLRLDEIEDLEYLPEEGLSNLTSLQELEIWNCPRLATLPPAMRCLTCLQNLWIGECSRLKERCREGEGEDWPNISHIPCVHVSYNGSFNLYTKFYV